MPIPLRVGGLARLSTCDWPGQLVATVFCQGCPWACRYCHNTHLIPPHGEAAIAWADVLAFLGGRRGLLDGVVFSGGEPLLQDGLGDAMAEVRAMGFAVGLHSGGAFPQRLSAVLPLVDWVGFDVKAPFDAYAAVTGRPDSGMRARDSLERLIAAGIPFEARTTVHPALLDAAGVLALAGDLRALGVTSYALQRFRSQGCTDPEVVASARLMDSDLPRRVAPLFARFEYRAN